MTAWVNANQELLATNVSKFLTKVVDNFGLIAKSIGVFFTLISVLKVLTLVLTAINLVMAANPIGLIIIGVGALIAGIVKLISFIREFKDELSTLSGASQFAIVLLSTQFRSLITIVDSVMSAWEPLDQFFSGLWSGIVDIFTKNISFIVGLINEILGKHTLLTSTVRGVGSGIVSFLGLGEDSEPQAQSNPSPQVVGPSERAARIIQENRSSTNAEVTIRDETGRAELTSGNLGPGLSLQPSGAF
jgi:phage-related protein